MISGVVIVRNGAHVRQLWIIICALLCLSGGAGAQATPTIEQFTVDRSDLDYEAVERGYEAANFSWRVSGLRPGDRLQMHALVGDTWVLIGSDFESARTDRLVIAHPLDFILPTYRLSVVDGAGSRVVERILSVGYAPHPPAPPRISLFNVNAVRPEAIADGAVMLPVSWIIEGRWQDSNPVFEQVLPSGRAVNIELPRADAWLPARGTGMVQPRPRPRGEALRLRLRVVERQSGQTLTRHDLALPAPELPPIEQFYVYPRDPAPGSIVTIVWNVPNAKQVWVMGYDRVQIDAPDPRPLLIYAQQPPSGAISYALPPGLESGLWFDLYVGTFTTDTIPAARDDLLVNPAAETPPRVIRFDILTADGQPASGRVRPGDSIRIEWQTENAQTVRIEMGYGVLPAAPRLDAPLPSLYSWGDLPPAGSLAFPLPDDERIHLASVVWLMLYPTALDGSSAILPSGSTNFALMHEQSAP